MRRSWICLTIVVAGTLFTANNALTADKNWQECELAERAPDRSIVACSKLIRQRRALSGAFHNRGVAYGVKGELDKAISDVSEGIRLDPGRAYRWQERGDLLMKQGKFREALSDFNQAIQLDPDRAFRYFARGNAYRGMDDLKQAIVEYDEAIRRDPVKRSFRYYDRGNTLRDSGQYERAAADYSVVIQMEPSDAWVLIERGRVYAKMGQAQLAQRDYEAARDLYPNDADVRNVVQLELSALPALHQPAIVQSLQNPAIQQATAVALPPVKTVPAAADTNRVALVVGNGHYLHAPFLTNPVSDARAVAASLRGLGFRVVLTREDVSREQTISALREFAILADNADWAVFYYAGHGIEFGGVNYIIPVDAQLKADRDIELETLDVGKVLSAIDGARKLRLVILDACRDNPFLSQMRRTTAARSVGLGLARMEPEPGTMIVYAAKHGEVALDGDGQNSPFVSALLSRIATPGLEVRRLFDLVRDDVLEATRRRQQPYVYGSLSGNYDYYFVSRH